MVRSRLREAEDLPLPLHRKIIHANAWIRRAKAPREIDDGIGSCEFQVRKVDIVVVAAYKCTRAHRPASWGR